MGVCESECVLGFVQKWKEEQTFNISLFLPQLSSAVQELLIECFLFNRACLLIPHSPGNHPSFTPFYKYI